MDNDVADYLARVEQERVQVLVNVDEARFDELHTDDYLLCNPTGTVWGKADYLMHLTSGQLVYKQLAATTSIEVLPADRLAVLRYRCAIELQVQGNDIPEHECWHMDIYTLGEDGHWRCKWSQATAIMETVYAT
ncbi:MAG: nuclear transport factor 2 family protein [Pseudonocardiaceae bacterium]